MSIGRITVDLLAKTGSFETDINRSAKLAAKRAKEIDDAFKRAGAAIGVALAAGATAAAAALKSTIDRMDEMSKAAQKVGLRTEEFSKLAYAAGLADVGTASLTGALGRLTKAQAEALKETSQQARIFDALGISARKADGSLRNSADVLADFADRFRDLEGSPEAMAAGFVLFGRSFQDLVPLLKDGGKGIRDAGAELEKMGGVLTTDAGQAAEEFNDNLTRLKTATESLAIQVADKLLPHLIKLTEEVLSFVQDGDNARKIADGLATSFRVVGGVVGFLWNKIDGFGKVVEGLSVKFVALADAARAFANMDWGALERARQLSDEGGRMMAEGFVQFASGRSPGSPQLPALELPKEQGIDFSLGAPLTPKEQAEMLERLQAALGGGGEKAGGKKGGAKKDSARTVDELTQAYLQLNASLSEQIALFGQTDEAARLRYEMEHGALSKLDPMRKQELLGLAQTLDTMREQQKLQEEGRRILESVLTPTERINEERERALELMKAGVISQADYNRVLESNLTPAEGMIKALEEEIRLLRMGNKEREREIALRLAGSDATEEQRKRIIELSDARLEATKAAQQWDEFERNIADTIFELGRNFGDAENIIKSFFDTLAQQILRSIAEDWAGKITDWLKGFASGGQGSNWITGLLGAFGFGGGRASGGPVGMGQTYLVGERGPELFVPRNAGMVIPAPQTAQMLGRGGVTVNQTVMLQGRPDRHTPAQIARETARTARREMVRTG